MLNTKNNIIKQVIICVLLLALSYIIGFGQFDLIKGIKMVAIYIFSIFIEKFVENRSYSISKTYESDIYEELNFPLVKYKKQAFIVARYLFKAFFTLGIVVFSLALVFNLIDFIADWCFDRVNTIFFISLVLNGLLYLKHESLNFIDKVMEEEKL